MTSTTEKLADIEAQWEAGWEGADAVAMSGTSVNAFAKLLTLARELAERVESPLPPLLPTDPDDERIVDELVAKATEGKRVTRMGRAEAPMPESHEEVMRGFRHHLTPSLVDGATHWCDQCGEHLVSSDGEFCFARVQGLAAYADRLARELAEERGKGALGETKA